MACALPNAAILALFCFASAGGATDPLLPDLPLQDQCEGGEEGCAVSLRQLRGELRVAEISEHNATATTGSAGNACVGQTGWDYDIAQRSYDCGMRTLGSAYFSGRCMARSQGVSRACGSCLGKLIHCAIPCYAACCHGNCFDGSACKECERTRCHAMFFACSGVEKK